MFISQKIDQALNYRHFDRERVPFAGGVSQITAKEYPHVTRRLKVAGYGLFDVTKPKEKHFGRTLSDLLNRAYLEQYVISVMQPYHEWVGAGDDKKLVLKLWVMWYEQIDVSKPAADTYAKTLELPGEAINRKSASLTATEQKAAEIVGGSTGTSRSSVPRHSPAAGNSRRSAGAGKIVDRGGGRRSDSSRD
jgi:hypothetical protein